MVSVLLHLLPVPNINRPDIKSLSLVLSCVHLPVWGECWRVLKAQYSQPSGSDFLGISRSVKQWRLSTSRERLRWYLEQAVILSADQLVKLGKENNEYDSAEDCHDSSHNLNSCRHEAQSLPTCDQPHWPVFNFIWQQGSPASRSSLPSLMKCDLKTRTGGGAGSLSVWRLPHHLPAVGQHHCQPGGN